MGLSRLLLAWALVWLWFAGWQLVRARVAGTESGDPASPMRGLLRLGVEALLLTLFAGLWFGSLGSGGWLLLFFLTGALVEIPLRLRLTPSAPFPWAEVALGLVRMAAAGGIYSAILP